MAHCLFKILYFETDQENAPLFVKLNILCCVQENFVHSQMNPLYNLRHLFVMKKLTRLDMCEHFQIFRVGLLDEF
jgi:hypothetical protein